MSPAYFQKAKRKKKEPKRYSSIPSKSGKEKLRAAKRLQSKRRPIAKKKRTESERERIYGPREFVAFLHDSQCLGCGFRGTEIQQAHRFTGGMGRKGRWQDSIPLCGPHYECVEGGGWVVRFGCHQSYDAAKQSWSRDHNLPARAAFFWESWEKFSGGSSRGKV